MNPIIFLSLTFGIIFGIVFGLHSLIKNLKIQKRHIIVILLNMMCLIYYFMKYGIFAPLISDYVYDLSLLRVAKGFRTNLKLRLGLVFAKCSMPRIYLL